MAWTFSAHAGAEALAEAVAGALAQVLREALGRRGGASLVLAGGRTPFPAYRRLAREALDWSAVNLLPSDERWVEAGDPASNLGELRSAFAGCGAQCLPLTPTDCSGPPSAKAALDTLTRLGDGRFDAVLLGMGADGHVASLFPGAHELRAGLCGSVDALVVNPEPLPPEAPFARISLSAPRLLHSRRLLLAVSGAAKRAVLEQAMRENDASRLPVCALLHQDRVPLEIHWFP